MSKTSIGTSDTGRGHGCPCGRTHPIPRHRRMPPKHKPVSLKELSDKATQAYAHGKASGDPHTGEHVLHYSGDCTDPITFGKMARRGQLHLTYEVRCRRCRPCLRAKQTFWALSAMRNTHSNSEQGLRTWFGTLTMRPEARSVIYDRALQRWFEQQEGTCVAQPEWFGDSQCNLSFSLLSEEFKRECQKYWKRLRKAGHAFQYLVTFERHRDGFPHAHWLLHEHATIRKRDLQEHWGLGFTKVKLVEPSHLKRTPAHAAFYVCKYISKYPQKRMCASRGYTNAVGSRIAF